MTIDEAIQSQEGLLYNKVAYLSPKEIVSTRIGIEALKLTLRLRADQPPMATQLLPGETQE